MSDSAFPSPRPAATTTGADTAKANSPPASPSPPICPSPRKTPTVESSLVTAAAATNAATATPPPTIPSPESPQISASPFKTPTIPPLSFSRLTHPPPSPSQPPGRAPGNTNTPLFPPLQQTLSSPPHPHHLTTTTAAATTTATNPPRSPKSLLPPLPPFPSKGPRPRLHHRARHRAHPRLNRPSHSLPVCRVHPLRPGAHEAPAPWSEPCCFAGGTVDGGLIFVWGVAGFVGVSYEGEGCSVPSLSGG